MPPLPGGGLPAQETNQCCRLFSPRPNVGDYGGKHPLELAKICETADMELFKNVVKDCNHVLYDLLPPKKMHGYNLRTRPHQHVLPIKNVYADKNFLDRMLYVDMY